MHLFGLQISQGNHALRVVVDMVWSDRDPVAVDPTIEGQRQILLGAPDRVTAMAAAGRRRAEEHYDWLKLGARLERWLRGLCA